MKLTLYAMYLLNCWLRFSNGLLFFIVLVHVILASRLSKHVLAYIKCDEVTFTTSMLRELGDVWIVWLQVRAEVRDEHWGRDIP